MEKIIIFYGSFDPLHNGHLKIAKEAIKSIKADKLYFGLNKDANLKKLVPFSKRKAMIDLVLKQNKKFSFINIPFSYKNIEKTYDDIFSFFNNKENEYYILIGSDQLTNLQKWYHFKKIESSFKFIIATRDKDEFIPNEKYIYLTNKANNISSHSIKEGNLRNLPKVTKNYIVYNNLYIENRIKKYYSSKRLKHVKSVKNLALKIYRNNKENLDRNKVITACLLHDIAKEYKYSRLIMNKYYKEDINNVPALYHQYVGEYLAKKKFHIDDKEILEAIKYHSTGNEKMSKLAKLLYVADKLDPLRDYDSTYMINSCIDNLEEGFKIVLKENMNYLKHNNIKIDNKETIKAINYYLK